MAQTVSASLAALCFGGSSSFSMGLMAQRILSWRNAAAPDSEAPLVTLARRSGFASITSPAELEREKAKRGLLFGPRPPFARFDEDLIHVRRAHIGRILFSTKRLRYLDSENHPCQCRQHLDGRRLVDVLNEDVCLDNSHQCFTNEEEPQNDDRNHRELSPPPGTECTKDRPAQNR